MNTCSGNGICLKLCFCKCTGKCLCTHGEHLDISEDNRNYNYCQTQCIHNCKLVKCNHFKHCREKFPYFYFNIHHKENAHSDIPHNAFLHIEMNCPICKDIRYMMQLECNHIVCFDCYQKIINDDSDIYYYSRCKICSKK
jgi:hypothetical protein